METDVIDLMAHHGVKPTANRILIAREMAGAGRPMSMAELEGALESIDKSVISRTLTLFREHHLVHAIQDGGDALRYELCHSHSDSADDDVHVHFFCERCRKTFCLEDIPIPEVALPGGWHAESLSYMVTGLCPSCSRE